MVVFHVRRVTDLRSLNYHAIRRVDTVTNRVYGLPISGESSEAHTVPSTSKISNKPYAFL